jgi:hypothetical protein
MMSNAGVNEERARWLRQLLAVFIKGGIDRRRAAPLRQQRGGDGDACGVVGHLACRSYDVEACRENLPVSPAAVLKMT